MSKKSASRNALKSLFSRSEVNLEESTEKQDVEKTEAQKKKFKFFKFKAKSKKGAASEQSASENQQVLSAVETNDTAEDEEAWDDDVVLKNKKTNIYGTAPRSKNKEFSYSELDLRKPKRFHTLSFGFKKRKKKDEENISKSTFGLHGPDTEEKDETSLDLNQMDLNQANTKMMFSMSQPELDTEEKFDIPSPPPVATKKSESPFTLPKQLQSSVPQPDATEPLTNHSALIDVHKEPTNAPIAFNPELQLDNKELNVPVQDNSSKTDASLSVSTTRSKTTCAVTDTASSLPASQPPIVLDTSDHKAALVESVSTGLPGNDPPEQSYTKTEICHSEFTSVTFVGQPDASAKVDGTAPSGESFLTSAGTKIDATIRESPPVPHSDKSALSIDSAIIHHELPVSHTEVSVSQTVITPAVSSKKTPLSVSQDEVYGELYDSLFPHNFSSEVISTVLNHPPEISTEIRHLNVESEPVVVKIRDECQTESNVVFSRLSTSPEFAACEKENAENAYTNVKFTDRKVVSSLENSLCNFYYTFPASELTLNQPPLSSLSSPSEDIYFSDLTRSHSEVKSDNFSLIQETVNPVSVVEASAPPVLDYVTSQGAVTQVTDSKRRVILVKEVATDELSTDPGRPSLVFNKMSTKKGLEIKSGSTESFSSPSGQRDVHDTLLSPTYLSVGSDDGSALEIYYSAEEDNAEESGEEEMYTMDGREDSCKVDGVKKVRLHEEQAGILERQSVRRYERDFKVVIVKMQNQEENLTNEKITEDVNCQQTGGEKAETKMHNIRLSEFVISNDIQAREKAVAAVPQLKEEGEEGRKEELLATPVEQVSKLTVCKVVPPSNELHGQGEGSEETWTKPLEREAHLNGEKQLPRQEVRYLAYKDTGSSECVHAASSYSRKCDEITPTFREAEERVSVTAHRSRDASEVSIETNSDATTNAVSVNSDQVQVATGTLTDSAELQSDATETEHNRPLRSSGGVDTVTQSAGRSTTVRGQVSVELSTSKTDTHHPDTAAAEGLSKTDEQPDVNQGSLTASSATTADSESQQTKTDETILSDKMNSGYSSLSTRLSIKNFSKEDESKYRVHKVSLINDVSAPSASQDTVDLGRKSTTVSNGTDLNSEYKWKNNFDGVSQYKSSNLEDSSFSYSYRIPDTYSSTTSSALPEATASKYLSNVLPSASSPSPSLEERIILGSRLSDRTEVYLSTESESVKEPNDEWRRSLLEREELSAPAVEKEGQREGELDGIESHWDSQPLSTSFSSGLRTRYSDSFKEDDESQFTGLFKATFVELVNDPPAPPSTPPDSPDAESSSQFDMASLLDTLKSMGPSQRPRSIGPRVPPQTLVSSLPPIVEDAPSPVASDATDSLTIPTQKIEAVDAPADSLDGLYTLPADLGLKRNSVRDTRSPLELMKQKQQQEQPGTKVLNLPLRASAASSIVMRSPSDSPTDDLTSSLLNGNGVIPSFNKGSRLENSIIFRRFRSSSIDQAQEDGKTQRPLFHTGSLPDVEPSNDRMSAAPKEPSEPGVATELAGSRFERLPFLLNSSSSSSGSLNGAEDPLVRMSRPPSLSISSPPSSNSPTLVLSPTGSIDLHRPFSTTDSPTSMFGQTQGMGMGVDTGATGAPILQRSFSSERSVGVQQTSLFNSVHGGPQFQSQELEPDRNLLMKYRAFPDAYRTKEKEHGKLNPRPGKMYIFDRPGMCGQRIEVRSDVIDATPWELQETISIRVIRGGWVLYEKPNFKGEKIALDEGDIELTYPFIPPEEQLQDGQKDGEEQNGETSDVQTETKPARRFIIGSVRRAVRDYSVPEICLFPEENAEGKKVIFRDTSDDARIFGFPIKANSIIINAGLWLVFAQPFFQGAPRVLEVGGYSNPAAWGVEQPYVGSVHPLKIAEPRVENMSEPKMVIYDKPFFSGKSRTITTNMRDFMTRTDRQQNIFMYSVGSLKVLGGIWVGYEKEGFRGHQYLLEEGEYHDWRVWGGCNAELRSVRVIRADLTDPLMVMIEQPEEEQETVEEENSLEVTEAIPDVELVDFRTSTRSIEVVSGAWIAYSHVDFSGNQYILEKGFYSNPADWGSQDSRICSVQPILLAPDENRSKFKIILYSEPDFQGECYVFDHNQEAVPEKLLTKSCRVAGGSWVLYENKDYSGNMYVLTEGEYPSLTSMGCPPGCTIHSVKLVPLTFSVPSVSLFGLECLEGREITTNAGIVSMAEEGLNNHVLSVKVNSGCWVICEHSNYRGRQFLLEPIEITNWPKFSSVHTIGSLYPVRQKRHFFRIQNKERGHFLSVQGGVEEMKSGRVVVTPDVEPMSDVWFYEDGLIKSKMSPTMSLQVMGKVEPGAKAVLWTETRQPVQIWTAQMKGLITSITFPGMVLDVKGGKSYDKDHVVVMLENEERPSQQWEIELL